MIRARSETHPVTRAERKLIAALEARRLRELTERRKAEDELIASQIPVWP